MLDMKDYMDEAVSHFHGLVSDYHRDSYPFNLSPLLGKDKKAYRSTLNKLRRLRKTCRTECRAAAIELNEALFRSRRFSELPAVLHSLRFALRALCLSEYLIANDSGGRRLVEASFAPVVLGEVFWGLKRTRGNGSLLRVFEQSGCPLAESHFPPFAAFRAWAPHSDLFPKKTEDQSEVSPIGTDLAQKILSSWSVAEGAVMTLNEQVWQYRQEEQNLLVVGCFGHMPLASANFTGLAKALQDLTGVTPFTHHIFDFRVNEQLQSHLEPFVSTAAGLFLNATTPDSAELTKQLNTLMYHAKVLSALEQYRDMDPRGPKGPVAVTMPIPGS
ncbi:MAG: hypothetical protein NTZ09_21770 [Candidatus Hydrogenedentes bacterium]|nr:hypothetical protein [Candidatus Hydrogenedentota bacterium]